MIDIEFVNHCKRLSALIGVEEQNIYNLAVPKQENKIKRHRTHPELTIQFLPAAMNAQQAKHAGEIVSKTGKAEKKRVGTIIQPALLTFKDSVKNHTSLQERIYQFLAHAGSSFTGVNGLYSGEEIELSFSQVTPVTSLKKIQLVSHTIEQKVSAQITGGIYQQKKEVPYLPKVHFNINLL